MKDATDNLKPKSIKVNYAWNMVYEVFALLTPLITTPYVSRVLGAGGVGIYSYTNSIAQIFILFGNLGVATYGQMEIASHRDNRQEMSRIFYELWIFRALAMTLSFCIYMLVSFMSTEYTVERMILGIVVLASIFDLTWLFRGVEDFSKVVVRNIAVKILSIILIFLLVKNESDIYIYIFIMAMSTLLGNLTFIFSMRKVLCKVNIHSLRILRHAKGCFIFFIPTIATSVYTILDKTMLGILTDGSVQNGYYEQAHRIEQVLLAVITSLNTIMRSRMSFLFKEGRFEEMKARLERSINFIMLISIPMALGIVSIAPVFIPFFLGDGFTESIVLLQIFAFLLIIIGLSNCLNTHFLGPSGRQGKNNYVLILGAAFNFIFNLIMIPHFGAVGAAMGSVLAETLILFGYLFLARDFIKAITLLKLGWRYIIAGIVMCLIVSRLTFLNLPPIFTLCVQVFCGICVYGLLLIILHDQFLYDNVVMIIKKFKNKSNIR